MGKIPLDSIDNECISFLVSIVSQVETWWFVTFQSSDHAAVDNWSEHSNNDANISTNEVMLCTQSVLFLFFSSHFNSFLKMKTNTRDVVIELTAHQRYARHSN